MKDLSTLYNPQSIAVVGASASRDKVGNVVVRNLMNDNFPGQIYPVNPKRDEIEGLKCYHSVKEIPHEVEQAVICIPAPYVSDAMRECGEKGVKSVVVITAGFKEVGPEGAEMEKEIEQVADRYDMNLMGPNCLGVMDTHTPINATFAEIFPIQGNISFFSQSGALGLAILDWSHKEELGFSKFISMGNKAQLNEADFLSDAAEDDTTDVIVAYLESIEDGSAFVQAARKAAQKKPVLVLKSGVSEAGAEAASSHTGALAGSEAGYQAAFKQSGVLRTTTMSDMFTFAGAFVDQPVPQGKKVAVVTNAGGTGVVCTDAIEMSGLELAQFTDETLENLREGLPEMANVQNPVDVIGDAGPDRYRFGLETVMADPNVDMAVVLLCATAFTEPLETAQHLIKMKEQYPEKPLVAAFTGGASVDEAREELPRNGIPCLDFPEQAVACLKGLVQHKEAQERLEKGRPINIEGQKEKAQQVFDRVRSDGRRILLGPEAMRAARAYGINTVPSELAETADEAVAHAGQMGYPVVLKVASPDIIHKTDIGGVQLDLSDEDSVRQAFDSIMAGAEEHRPEADVYGVEVQKMVAQGQELIVGLTSDPQFGPLLMFGLGGIFVDLMEDVSFRLAEGLRDVDVDEMIAETKAAELLEGYRGESPKDVEAVKDTITRIAQLACDFPEIAELDINPFFAYEEGVAALDVKITLQES